MTNEQKIESAKESLALLNGWKAGFADAHRCEEPSILVTVACELQCYIQLMEETGATP